MEKVNLGPTQRILLRTRTSIQKSFWLIKAQHKPGSLKVCLIDDFILLSHNLSMDGQQDLGHKLYVSLWYFCVCLWYILVPIAETALLPDRTFYKGSIWNPFRDFYL